MTNQISVFRLQGTLAPESAVLKLSGKQFDEPFKGPVGFMQFGCCVIYVYFSPQAIVFDGEGAAYDAVMGSKVSHDVT